MVSKHIVESRLSFPPLPTTLLRAERVAWTDVLRRPYGLPHSSPCARENSWTFEGKDGRVLRLGDVPLLRGPD